MMRKLTVISTVISLVVGLCLMGVAPVLAQKSYSTLTEYEKATGEKITRFNEAPMLKALVDAGELPPVEQRLPEEPLVLEPKDEIGQYGGTLNTGTLQVNYDTHAQRARAENLFRIDPTDLTFIPNIAKGWDLSKDCKTLTVYLRKGMKWSDGAPFTADDILFWYNDMLLNDELSVMKAWWCPGGEVLKVEKLNDYAVQFQFAAPYPVVVYFLSGLPDWRRILYPKHYLKKWHPKYNPKADEIAKEEGFDYWTSCFEFHGGSPGGSLMQADVNLPTLDAWAMEEIDSAGNRYLKRNPYFFKVDTAGNQLPYIDEQVSKYVESAEVLGMKMIAGEYSYVILDTKLENYPLYKENEKKSGYRVVLAKWSTNQLVFSFNYAPDDPVKRKIFNDIRFRQAMSLAINREEMNNTLFYGKGTPYQKSVLPGASFHEDWMGKYYAQYDPKKANELLDEIGLKRGEDGYRMRPDGKTLTIIVEFFPPSPVTSKMWELIVDNWKEVGIKTAYKEVKNAVFVQHRGANKLDVGSWVANEAEISLQQLVWNFYPPFAGSGTPKWGNWFWYEGEIGEEPPEEMKELFKLAEKFVTLAPSTEEYRRVGKELITRNLEGLYSFGTVNMVPQPFLIDANLRNTPEEGCMYDYAYGDVGLYEPLQWFFEK